MNRILLSMINAPLLVIAVILGVAFQGSFFSFHPIDYFRPDFTLLIVIWIANRRPFIEGGILTLIFAEITEVHSTSPQGFFFITYMGAFLILYSLAKYLIFSHRRSFITLAAWASVGTKLLGLLFLRTLGVADRQWEHTLLFLLPGAMVQAALAPLLFKALERFDLRTFKDPRVRERLQDEMHLEEEGL